MRQPHRLSSRLSSLAAAAVLTLVPAAPASATESPAPAGPAVPAPDATPAPTAPAPEPAAASRGGSDADLDVLFVGAHPDDEAFTLSTLGQWNEDHGIRAGAVTVTRGEGGGNAVGPEEGPALGLLREGEERTAVAKAGVREVFNLDDVDFYYTVSAPLTHQIWGGDTLEKVVRTVRQTRPEVLLTMDPAPSPGNHGNHQQAARLAVEAYHAAADPRAFPEQITREGLRPFAPARVLLGRARGVSRTGPDCASTFRPDNPAQNVYGVWSGNTSQRQGRTWAAIERDAQRVYASQGWAVFPDVPTDPAQLGCDYFTLVDSRTPVPAPGTPAAAAPTAVLDGALVRTAGAVPLGTLLDLRPSTFDVRPGVAFTVKVTATAPSREPLGRSAVTLNAPDGWRVSGSGELGRLAAGRTGSASFTVTPPQDAAPGDRARLAATLTTERGRGHTDRQVEVSPAVRGGQRLLPQVGQYETWAAELDVPQLRGLVTPVLTIPSGGSRQVEVVVTNVSDTTQSGSVRLAPPAGFTADRAEAGYRDLAAGASARVSFTVTNTDTSLKTSNEGGDYAYTIMTTSGDGSSVSRPALELVPATSIPQSASAPVVDGVAGDGEYTGPVLDVSRLWEGAACSSAADCSGTARLAWRDDTLFALVQVKDEAIGTRLPASDCKRHWRTDAVEVTLDPRGTSENTSTTFKAAVLPVTAEGPLCLLRDADNHQGPDVPGMRVAAKVASGEYAVEMAIPMELLPGAVGPARLGLNILVYDSDTQDKTGQTRIGWSTWGGVQGDPYRWGVATLPGYQPPPGRPTTPPDPVIPDTGLSSLDSPQSLEQAVRLGLPLAGGPAARPSERARITSAVRAPDAVRVTLRAGSAGRAHLFVRDDRGTAGSRVVTVSGRGTTTVRVPLTRPVGAHPTVVAGWQAPDGGTAASATRVR
ncbi:sugar-binding protein [Nonomuraea sp. NPDC059194]|uniref:sugar-binding protein n=1 Tax=Nonomuraea sp. NPDC059194 TaxID=3346764 RepID=UPI0036BD42FB